MVPTTKPGPIDNFKLEMALDNSHNIDNTIIDIENDNNRYLYCEFSKLCLNQSLRCLVIIAIVTLIILAIMLYYWCPACQLAFKSI